MKTSDPSMFDRLQNEVTFKRANENIRTRIEEIMPNDDRTDLNIRFTCECSREQCRELIEVQSDKLANVHDDIKRFLLVPGHEQNDIEKVVERQQSFVVVEKFVTPPPTDGLLNSTA